MKPYKAPYKDHGSRHAPGGTDPIPGLGGVAAVAWARGSTSSIVSGGSALVEFATFDTTDTSIFGTDTSASASAPFHNTTGDSHLYGSGLGFYLVFGWSGWSASVDIQMQLGADGGQWDLLPVTGNRMPSEFVADTSTPAGSIGPASFRMYYVDSADQPMTTAMHCFNSDSVSHSVLSASIAVYYYEMSADMASIY